MVKCDYPTAITLKLIRLQILIYLQPWLWHLKEKTSVKLLHCTIETFIYTENRLPPTLEFIHYTKYLINTVFLSKCHHGMMQDEAHKSLINHDPRLKEEQYPVIVIGCQWLLWWTTFYRKKNSSHFPSVYC